ncbi:CD225/dispanin family protein [Demequina sediminicola]|uniref:CD225/dispanin family protein n=1 Tax=Demequina sediminicola TaxID=1095026 RepID=UPI000785CA2D|nr:CD225/dispanin family protein [Demequina sediminicola]
MSDVTPPPPGQPPYGATPPPPGGFNDSPPNNYLALAIVTTILCCLPLGIWAIVQAASVNGKWVAGDRAGAIAASETAKKVSIWGIVIGAVGLVLYILLLVGGVLSLETY